MANNGCQFINRKQNRFTNANVVPYNPWLLMKYRCHINVLACMTEISSVRYLFRYYTTKGQDMATIKMTRLAGGRNRNQTTLLHQKRYGEFSVSDCVRCHRQRFDSLSIYQVRGSINEYLADGDGDFQLLYTNVSKYFTWEAKRHCWIPRERVANSPTGEVLNRVDTVSITSGEKYYLRQLLLVCIANPTSFDYLRTYNNTQFQEAAVARGLPQDDSMAINAMHEAILMQAPRNCSLMVTWKVLRNFF
eukprot:scaffold12174_cov66-Cylindrotheca_fusiformis.AAC.3